MNDKIIAIMQPTYMPWMGYFSMIDKVDEFVFLDMVQLVSRSWQVRNKIKLNNKEKILTIPVRKEKKREERLICNTQYLDESWKRSHLDTIKMAYKKAPFYDEVYAFLLEIYKLSFSSIGSFNCTLIQKIAKKIGIATPFVSAAELIGEHTEAKKDWLLAILCIKLNAGKYLSAKGSAAYIEKNSPGGKFREYGIDLFYHNYIHPEYPQTGDPFLPYMGIYDLLFHVGFEQALPIIRSGNRKDIDDISFHRE